MSENQRIVVPEQFTKTATPKDEGEMRQMLENQGIVFHPRLRKAQIPKIGGPKIAQIVGDEVAEVVMVRIGNLTEYLETPAITDHFGSDHEARRAWRTDMLSQHRDLFRQVYEKNQLRINVMTPVVEAITTLEKVIPGMDQSELIDELRETEDYLVPITQKSTDKDGQMIQGQIYNNMSNEEKIAFVRTLEDHILKVLAILGQGSRGKAREIFIT